MSTTLKRVEEHIVETRKRVTYWLVFNTAYNDLFVFEQLGAELNIWYDRKYKKWLEMQYRLGFSSDYFSETDPNILMDGMFITKIRIFRQISLRKSAFNFKKI